MEALLSIVREPVSERYFQTTTRINWDETVKVRDIASKIEEDIKLVNISLYENEIFVDGEWYKIIHMLSMEEE